MIAPSFHPATASATCEPRGRASFGLTARSIVPAHRGLLPSSFPASGMRASVTQCWRGMRSCFSPRLLDGMRLPHAAKLTASRTWSNAPSLDSQTEIELTIENQGAVIIECRLIDDLPPALRDPSAQQEPVRVTAFPRVPASHPLPAGTAGTRRLHHRPALRSL